MVDETLDGSSRLAATDTGIGKGKVVSEKPRLRASHWH